MEMLFAPAKTATKRLYIESYGCAMNLADSEVIASILKENGYETWEQEKDADIIFLNTCAIRENAEDKIWHRLKALKGVKKHKPDLIVGVLGCMAERLKTKLLDESQLVDLVVGPDAYRDLPTLLAKVDDGQKAVNVLLSREETYAEIAPIRLNSNGINAFISIMRGCDNMCSFCVVPFTRGRERSRDPYSIVREAEELVAQGYKEVTLLGQNVDSYKWTSDDESETVNFAGLLELTAKVSPELRVRFSTSHPKDITDEVLYTMLKYDNICKHIHLPAQSGNSRVLKLMNRTYDRAWYMERVHKIRELIPECGITCDIIAGFCSETEEEHQDTLSLIEECQFDFSYMYYYSERPGTLAARRYPDDVPLEVKKRRLQEIVDLQNAVSRVVNEQTVGKVFRVLIEGTSKKSKTDFKGRSDQNVTCIFPMDGVLRPGDYANVLIERTNTATLIGRIV